jgi:hypothetical protein
VNRVIEKHPDVFPHVEVPRARALNKSVIEQNINAVAAANCADFADGALDNPLFDLPIEWVATHLKRHLKVHTAFFDGGDDTVAIIQSRRHRLLAKNAFARPASGLDEFEMAIGFTGDNNGIYITTF